MRDSCIPACRTTGMDLVGSASWLGLDLVARKAANRWASAQPSVRQRKSHCPAASVRGDPVHRRAFNSPPGEAPLADSTNRHPCFRIGLHRFQAIQSGVCPHIRPLHSSRVGREKCSRWGDRLAGRRNSRPKYSGDFSQCVTGTAVIIPLFCRPFQSATRGASLYS